jgi:hypothetical protein
MMLPTETWALPPVHSGHNLLFMTIVFSVQIRLQTEALFKEAEDAFIRPTIFYAN